MKIYLLDCDKEMVEYWQTEFTESENLKIVHSTFDLFMRKHKNEIDGIVSPANSFGLMDGGYDKAIIDFLGERAQTNVLTLLDSVYPSGYQSIGTCFPVSFGKYHILHTPTMRTPEEIIDRRVIFDCMLSCLNIAEKLDLKAIVIPAFGALTGKVPKFIVAKLMVFAYNTFYNNDSSLDGWAKARAISSHLKEIADSDKDVNYDDGLTIAHGLATDAATSVASLTINNTESTNTLMTLGDYVKNNEHVFKTGYLNLQQEYSEPKYKCPKCGGNVRKNLTMVLTSNPPKFRYECDNNPKCDYVGFHEY